MFLTKSPLNYYSLKVTKFHGDSVKNESASAKKLEGGGAKLAPSPLFIGLNVKKKKKYIFDVCSVNITAF